MKRNPTQNQGKYAVYLIKIEGLLDPSWSEWFNNLDISYIGDKETLLSGSVRDQAALHGLLIKVRDLGFTLLSVERIEPNSVGTELEKREAKPPTA